MSEQPVPLSPDDTAQTDVRLSEHRHASGQPYGAAALMLGLVVLLLLRAVFMPGLLLLNGALLVTAIAYIALLAARPHLPLHLLTVVAAELGLLYSLPYQLVFFRSVSSSDMLFLGWSMIFAGIVGLLLGYWLKVEERASEVLLLNFLVLFVITSFLLLPL